MRGLTSKVFAKSIYVIQIANKCIPVAVNSSMTRNTGIYTRKWLIRGSTNLIPEIEMDLQRCLANFLFRLK